MEVGNVVYLLIFTMRLEARALWVKRLFQTRDEGSYAMEETVHSGDSFSMLPYPLTDCFFFLT